MISDCSTCSTRFCLGEAIECDLHYRRGYSRTLWWIRVHQDILIEVSRPLHCFTGDLERCESKSRPGGRGGGGADLQSSTHRISDQLLLLYRKIPIISPGLIQLRDGRLGGLINRGGPVFVGGTKKGSRKKLRQCWSKSTSPPKPGKSAMGTRLDQNLFLNKSISLQYKLEGGLYSGGGL